MTRRVPGRNATLHIAARHSPLTNRREDQLSLLVGTSRHKGIGEIKNKIILYAVTTCNSFLSIIQFIILVKIDKILY